jgi:hypothetical protein
MSYVSRKQLDDLLEQLEERVIEGVVGKVSGLMTRQAAAYDERFEELEEGIGEAVDNFSDEFLDEIIAEAEEYDDDFDEDEYDDEDDDEFLDEYGDDSDDEYEEEPMTDPRVLREIANLRRQNQALQAQQEQDREDRENEREELEYQRMMNDLERQLQGRVVNPRQFIKLLDDEGLLVQAGNQLAIAIEDEYGEDAVDILDALPELLEDDDYAHFEPARPGTGTGASQSGGNQSYIPDHRRVYLKEKPSADDVLKLAKDPAKFDEMLAELDSAF